LVVSIASWRFVFALVAPFALAAALVLPRASSAADRQAGPPVDYLGAALATTGLGATIGALIIGPRRGFSDALVVSGLVAGALLLVLFIIASVVPAIRSSTSRRCACRASWRPTRRRS